MAESDADVTSPAPTASDLGSPGLAAAKSPSNVRQLVLVLACSISFLLYLHRYTWGFVKKDVSRQFGWDTVTLGWLDSLFTVTYGLAQIPAGALCDWFGARALLGASIIVWSLALGGMAAASGVISMGAARLTFGLAQAGCYPFLNKISRNWFPFTYRTTAQSWIATFFGRLGGAASFILFGTVLLGWWQMQWRLGIGLFAILGVICGIVFLLLFRNTPSEHPWANAAEAQLIAANDPAATQATRSHVHWGNLCRSINVWFLLWRAFLSNMADVFYVYWIPLYLQEEKGLSNAAAGWQAALPLIGGALGGLASGWMQNRLLLRTGNRRWARSSMGLGGKFLAAICILLSLAFVDGLAVACVLLLVKFFSDWEQPAEWATVSDIAGPNAATVFACVNMVGALGGFVAGPLIGSILSWFSRDERLTTAGWTAVFIVIAVEYFLAGLAWIWIDCRRPIDPPPSVT